MVQSHFYLLTETSDGLLLVVVCQTTNPLGVLQANALLSWMLYGQEPSHAPGIRQLYAALRMLPCRKGLPHPTGVGRGTSQCISPHLVDSAG